MKKRKMNKTEELASALINGYILTDYYARAHDLKMNQRDRQRKFLATKAVSMIHSLPQKQVERAIGMFNDYFDLRAMSRSDYQIFLASGKN